MKTQFTDDVSGTIIGSDYVKGWLVYDGRKQGQDMYATDEAELTEEMRQHTCVKCFHNYR